MSNWQVFPNGTSFMMWRASNCDRCRKDYNERKHRNGVNTDCPIENAIGEGSLTGEIPFEHRDMIRERLKWDGRTYLEHDCPEFEPEQQTPSNPAA